MARRVSEFTMCERAALDELGGRVYQGRYLLLRVSMLWLPVCMLQV